MCPRAKSSRGVRVPTPPGCPVERHTSSIGAGQPRIFAFAGREPASRVGQGTGARLGVITDANRAGGALAVSGEPWWQPTRQPEFAASASYRVLFSAARTSLPIG